VAKKTHSLQLRYQIQNLIDADSELTHVSESDGESLLVAFSVRVSLLPYGGCSGNVLRLLFSGDCTAHHGGTVGLCALPNGQFFESVVGGHAHSTPWCGRSPRLGDLALKKQPNPSHDGFEHTLKRGIDRLKPSGHLKLVGEFLAGLSSYVLFGHWNE
jgi:hypothetical protein